MANESNKQDEMFGCIFLIVILFIAFWYWHCSDGIRAVKNMHVYEIFSDDIKNEINTKGEILLGKSYLEAQGYNIDLTFEEAIERTSPTKVVFESLDDNLPEYNGDSVKGVSVTVTYEPPLDNKYTSITMIFGVQKEWFFNFNPTILAPAMTSNSYVGGKIEIISRPSHNNLQVAEQVLRYFRDKIR